MDSNRIDEQVGANIKKIRTLRGFSRQKLGDYLEVKQQTIEKYETGKNRIDAATLVRIAFFLTCSVMDLMQGVDLLLDNKAQPDNGLHKKTDQDMLKYYHDIKDEGVQTAVRNLTRAMALYVSALYKPQGEKQ